MDQFQCQVVLCRGGVVCWGPRYFSRYSGASPEKPVLVPYRPIHLSLLIALDFELEYLAVIAMVLGIGKKSK